MKFNHRWRAQREFTLREALTFSLGIGDGYGGEIERVRAQVDRLLEAHVALLLTLHERGVLSDDALLAMIDPAFERTDSA